MKDVFGRTVIEDIEVEIDEDLLKKIANKTDAKYYRATDGNKLLEIYNEIDKLEKIKVEEVVYTFKESKDDIKELYKYCCNNFNYFIIYIYNNKIHLSKIYILMEFKNLNFAYLLIILKKL